MKSYQVHPITAAVACNSKQIIDAFKPGFARQIVGEIFLGNRCNRIDDDLPFFHWVAASHFYVRILPDANAAFDPAAPNPIAKTFCEHHISLIARIESVSKALVWRRVSVISPASAATSIGFCLWASRQSDAATSR